MPVGPRVVGSPSEAFHTYQQNYSTSSALIWANPTLTAINALALRGTAEDVATPGVALSGTPPAQLFRPSLLHWLEALSVHTILGNTSHYSSL